MFCKVSVFVTLLAASAQLVAANTPSCLLAAINTQDNPADLKAVCKNSSDVESTITSTCGNNAQAAMAAFKSVCQGAGVAVSAYASSSTSATGTGAGTISASATGGKISATSTIIYTSHYYDNSCSCTKATMVTGTAYIGPSGIATGTSGINGTIPAQATGAASSGAGAGSSSMAGAATASGSASASASSVPASTGAAGKVEIAGLSIGALAMAGLVMVL